MRSGNETRWSFAGRGEQWAASLREYIETALSSAGIKLLLKFTDDELIVLDTNLFSLRLNARGPCWLFPRPFHETKTMLPTEALGEPLIKPNLDLFVLAFCSREVPSYLHAELAPVHSLLALLRQGAEFLNRALQTSEARLYARPDTPLAPFQQIAYQQWRLYWPDDNHPTTYCATGGASLHDPHVLASRRQPTQRQRTTINTTSLVRKWLVDLMKKHGETAPYPREKLREMAARDNGWTISKEQFTKAVRAAEVETGVSWSRPGRPPKSTRPENPSVT